MKDFNQMNILEVSNGIKQGGFSAFEVFSEFAKNIENDTCNAFITKTLDLAERKAKEIDQLKKEEKEKYQLLGVPFVAKDAFCTKGIKSTCGSAILESFIPQYESTVTERILEQGAMLLGKTNQDEFCMGSAGDTSAFGSSISPLKNKRDLNAKIAPGGSSSGSAISVANNCSIFSIGTDTGGSIKEPASFCNIYGFRPTYGTFSRYGMITYSSSLDQAGFFTKNIEDISILYDIVKGSDGKDLSIYQSSLPNISDNLNNFEAKDFTVGIPTGSFFENLPEFTKTEWRKAIKKFESTGVRIIECELDYAEFSIEAYAIITMAEAFSNLSKFDGIRFGYNDINSNNLEEMYFENRSKFGEEVKRRIMLGSLTLSAEFYEKSYIKACQIRRLIYNSYQKAFEKCDLILTPTVADIPFELGKKMSQMEMWLIDFLTLPSNLAGLGGVSVPFSIHKESGLPLGMQLVSNRFQDIKMLQGAIILQS